MSHYDRCICIHGWLFILIYVVFLLIIVLLLLFWSRRIKLNIMFPAEARNGWNLLPVKSNIKTVKSQWRRISCLPDRRETLQTNCLKRFAYFSPNFYSGKSAQFGLDFRPQLRLTRSSFEKKANLSKAKTRCDGSSDNSLYLVYVAELNCDNRAGRNRTMKIFWIINNSAEWNVKFCWNLVGWCRYRPHN